jgi:hypothetical protein
VKAGELAKLERQQTQLFVNRNGGANGQCRQCCADRSVGINGFGRFGNLHGDQRRQGG